MSIRCEKVIFGHDDLQTGKLRLNLWLLLERVDDALLEIVAVPLHVLPCLFVCHDRCRQEVLVPQDMAAVVIGVDHIEHRFAPGQTVYLVAQGARLARHHRGIDHHCPGVGQNGPIVGPSLIGLNKDAGRDLAHRITSEHVCLVTSGT